MEILADYGLIGLFTAAFFAATILPLSSEALLLFIIASGDQIMIPVLVASMGNIAGSFLNYYLGWKGNRLILNKFFRLTDDEIEKASQRFVKYGSFSMLFAWVPVIGDPLTVVAGIFKMNIWLFTILVAIGKFSRYLILALSFSAL
ncbi:MAG: DedA family protein [Calditrichaceae bacterium]|nr:DedA family protein [Calditrichaceae bacterium]